MFSDSSETEMNIDIDTTVKTKPPIDREEKLRKVEEKLLSNKAHERFTNYDGVMSDNNLSLSQKIIDLQKAIDDAMRRKILWASLRFRENYLKNAFINQRKFIKKLWRKRSLQESERYFYGSYTNSFSTAVNLNFALFPYVFSL